MLAKAAFESIGEVRSSTAKHARRERGGKGTILFRSNNSQPRPNESGHGGFCKESIPPAQGVHGCRLGGDQPTTPD